MTVLSGFEDRRLRSLLLHRLKNCWKMPEKRKVKERIERGSSQIALPHQYCISQHHHPYVFLVSAINYRGVSTPLIHAAMKAIFLLPEPRPSSFRLSLAFFHHGKLQIKEMPDGFPQTTETTLCYSSLLSRPFICVADGGTALRRITDNLLGCSELITTINTLL